MDSLLGGGTAITGIDINSGSIDGTAIGANSASTGTFTSVMVDNITVNGNQVLSTDTNGNIQLFANGTGFVELYGNTNAGAIRFNCESNSHGVTIKGPPHSAAATYSLELPNADGTSGQFLKTDGSGKLSFGTPAATTLSDLGITASAAEVNYNDITTLGTSEASKTVTADANGKTTFAGTVSVQEIIEKVDAETSTTGTINFNVLDGAVANYTANQTANRTINFRGNMSTSLDSTLAVDESVTVAIAMAQGSTAYYLNTYQIDGSAVTPKWQGGTAPSGGNASSIDVYSFTIIKTASATFTVLASQSKFA